MSKPIDELKNRLKIAINCAGIKPIELSEKTGIPKSSISQYMSGYAKPNLERKYLIAKALNVSESWLMGFDVPMERDYNKKLFDDVTNENNGSIADFIVRLRNDKDFRNFINVLIACGELSTIKKDLLTLICGLTESEASVLLVALRMARENN